MPGMRDPNGKLSMQAIDKMMTDFRSGHTIRFLQFQHALPGNEVAGILRSFGSAFELERDMRYDQACSTALEQIRAWFEKLSGLDPDDQKVETIQGHIKYHAEILEMLYKQAAAWRRLAPGRRTPRTKKGERNAVRRRRDDPTQEMGASPDDIDFGGEG